MKQVIRTKQRRSKVKAAFKTPACAVPIKGHMRHLLMDALRNTNCLKCVSELYLQQVCCKCQKDICSSCMLLSFDGKPTAMNAPFKNKSPIRAFVFCPIIHILTGSVKLTKPLSNTIEQFYD